MQGTPFGRYRLIDLLGRGGMGEVWRAHDTGTDRVVAIKVLPANLSEDADFQRRFRREAHTAARLDNPHVVPIYDYGEIDGRLFVSMRLIKGRDLDTVLDGGPLDPARAVRIIDQVARALQAAHKVGLLHRDIKPSNILLDDDGFAYLIDFGIARVADETRMTKSGSTVGTFAYIAPERLDPRADEDARADIYSLACVLYECLTGDPPFAGDTMAHLVAAHLATPPPRPSTAQPNVSERFDEVIATGMAKDPDKRFTTIMELAEAAHDAITGPVERQTLSWVSDPGRSRSATDAAELPPRAESTPSSEPVAPARRLSRRPKIVLGAVAVVVAVVAVVAYLLWPRPSSRQIVLLTGLAYPHGVAVDSADSVYVVDHDNNKVLELAAGSTKPTALPFTGLDWPSGVAVDSGRTVYVTDSNNNRVLKLAAGSNTAETLPFTGRFALVHPRGVAVDAHNVVYVADHDNHRVLRLAAGSNAPDELPFNGLNFPAGVAVDSNGNVYVSDEGSIRVYELQNLGGLYHPTDVSFPGLSDPPSGPHGVAVDRDGNVYVTDASNRVLKLAAGTTTELPFTGLNSPGGVAVDSGGAVYVADWGHGRVLKLPRG